jgi:thiamine-phosphate pyrophosphorylase
MAVSQARKRLGKNFLIGYSSHSLEEAREAERRGADYVAFGAIFPTPLKGPGHPIQGLDRLREVVRAMTIPVVAIGGIDRTNFAAVVETGVSAVAMIRALVAAKDISSEARWFVRNFP